jgi:hypothetical protein
MRSLSAGSARIPRPSGTPTLKRHGLDEVIEDRACRFTRTGAWAGKVIGSTPSAVNSSHCHAGQRSKRMRAINQRRSDPRARIRRIERGDRNKHGRTNARAASISTESSTSRPRVVRSPTVSPGNPRGAAIVSFSARRGR